MEKIILTKVEFQEKSEDETFRAVFEVLASKLGEDAFVRFRGTTATGALAPAYYEAVSMAVLNLLPAIRSVDAAALRDVLSVTVQSSEFRDVTGPGANSRQKLEGRIQLVTSAFRRLLP
jgi:hypothetical protein